MEDRSILERRQGRVITEMALPALLTDDLDLAGLPTRLDDRTLGLVKALANSCLPPHVPCSDRHFSQCLRVMLSVLPKRQSDELSGELFVGAYQRKLGHFPDAAISFLADKAMERCQWFPTIHECLEILGDWRRNDEHVTRKALANRIAQVEQDARRDDKRDWERETDGKGMFMRPPLTIDDVEKMPPHLLRVGLACGALMEEGGKIVPWRQKEGVTVF